MFDNLGTISFESSYGTRKDFYERASDKWTSVLPHHRDEPRTCHDICIVANWTSRPNVHSSLSRTFTYAAAVAAAIAAITRFAVL